jgi:hypothetical protein
MKHWTFWRNNTLFLLPETKYISAYLNLNLNSRVYFLDTNLSLYEIFKYQLEDPQHTEQRIGDVNLTSLLSKIDYIWKRRTDLRNIHLNIIYLNNPPFNIRENGSQRVEGFFGEIFQILQSNLGFHYTLIDPGNSSFGSPQSNGLYNGLLGQIQTGKVNWSLSDMAQTLVRAGTFDFSIPIINQAKQIVTKKPTEEFDTEVYIVVFSDKFWIALLCSAVILVFFMYWILRLDSVDDKYQSNRLAAAFSFTMLSLVCRESYVLDASWSGKILFLSVLFWGFLISVSYNAILTSVLASSRTSPPINSLEDLLDSPDYTLVLKTSGVVRDFFQNAPNNSIGKMYKTF